MRKNETVGHSNVGHGRCQGSEHLCLCLLGLKLCLRLLLLLLLKLMILNGDSITKGMSVVAQWNISASNSNNIHDLSDNGYRLAAKCTPH